MKLDERIENLNVYSEDKIITPAELKEKYPLSEKAVSVVMEGQKTINNILSGKDKRKLIIVGPCSIHNPAEALDYAGKLKILSEEVKEKLFLVMRVYFEKPRTSVGWQGLINDPYLDNSCKIDDGLGIARTLLLNIAEIGLPTSGEALDLITPQYVQDLFSWTAIGARTTESQTHRKMASGFSCAVGFKNGTDGNIQVAVNAMKSAAHPHNFISINPEGHSAIVRTKGNKHSHIVLRGGGGKSNYDEKSIKECESILESAGLPPKIMVDCSHENSSKNPENQKKVIAQLTEQINKGNKSIFGLMIESHLKGGNQVVTKDLKDLQYGVSITDGCLSFSDTEEAIINLYNSL